MKIFILHLSDFHIGSTDCIISSSKEICRAVEDIAADCDYGVIVVTGDLASTGNPDEYSEIMSIFTSIKDYFRGSVIDKDIIIVTVPGNHDCNFSTVDPDRSSQIDKIKSISQEEISIEMVNQCAAVQADYFDFDSHAVESGPAYRLGYPRTVKFGDYQITFYCYNTAWMSVQDQPPASLIFPITCVERSLPEVKSNLNISLLHHPLEWFTPENKRLFKGYLTRTSDLVLTGHEHKTGKRLEDNLEGKITLYIEGGKLQDNDDVDGCGFISLVIDTSTSNQRIMEYKWNGSTFGLIKESQLILNNGRMLGRKSMNFFEISEAFEDNLSSLEAPIFHSNMTRALKLDDIYVFPMLKRLDEIDKQAEAIRRYYDSSQFTAQIGDVQKVLILGEAKSGKTMLCKSLFRQYHQLGYVPVYLNANEIQHSSLEAFDKLLEKCFEKQYKLKGADAFSDIDGNKIVLFIDDFEKIRMPSEEMVGLLEKIEAKYQKLFIFANSILQLEDLIVKESRLFLALNDFQMFSILQFGFELRHKLVRRWNRIGVEKPDTEELLRKDDEYDQKMNILVGDGGIITPYPIFLLTILLAIQSENTQTLEESSYSHYYQFIISQALVRLNLTNADLDSYYSFLTNLAKRLFSSSSRIISHQELADFHNRFIHFYRVSPHSGMVYQFEKLIGNLCAANLLEEGNGNYSFKQGFVYFYFVGKYLSENRTSVEEKKIIMDLISSVQYDEYSNILMFIIHHTKEEYILRAMVEHAKGIFDQYSPLKLEEDTSYISDLIEEIPVLLLKRQDVQEYRTTKLREKDNAYPPTDKTPVLRDKVIPPKRPDDPKAIEFITNTIIASKLIGLMGQILLNYRSIPGDTQDEIAEEVYLLGLRSLSGLFGLLQSQDDRIIDNIARRIIADDIHGEDRIKKQAKIILFNMYHLLAYVIIKLVSTSLGTDTLSAVIVNIPKKYPYLSVALIDISAKLDHYRGIPQSELSSFMESISTPPRLSPSPSSSHKNQRKSKSRVQKSRLLPFVLLRQLIEEYTYKFPPTRSSYKDRQRICSLVGIETQAQLIIEKTSVERAGKENE